MRNLDSWVRESGKQLQTSTLCVPFPQKVTMTYIQLYISHHTNKGVTIDS